MQAMNLEKYVKVMNNKCCHYGMQYKDGLNEDIHPFVSKETCGKGGLYFCKLRDIHNWIHICYQWMEYIWDVEIPEGEEIIDMGDKLKAHRIILSNKRNIWDAY